ncbi:Hypothetical predicted protein [Pelobates cultripes]|uniref:Uncharacterized protein n=1 Tax=Pelobates cultripes TaxID=61616 RepID=A0AAD1RCM4_PELCU|nr:Hypothetical predicted protein [Pelobates cultripes]
MARYHRAIEPLAGQNQPDPGSGHSPKRTRPIRTGVWRRNMMIYAWTIIVRNIPIQGPSFYAKPGNFAVSLRPHPVRCRRTECQPGRPRFSSPCDFWIPFTLSVQWLDQVKSRDIAQFDQEEQRHLSL